MRLIAVTTWLCAIIMLWLPGSLHGRAQADVSDPYAIYHRHYEAIGGLERLKALKTSYSEGTIQFDGLHGTVRQWEKHVGRFRRQEDYGVIQLTSGDDGKVRWSQDTNGKLAFNRDKETLQRRRISALLEEFKHLERPSPYFSMAYEGLATCGPGKCHVVRLENSINRDVSQSYFDAESFLLVRTIVTQPDIVIDSRYDDWRTIDGIGVAFFEQSKIHPRDRLITVRLNTFQPHIAIAEKRFAPPLQDAADFHFDNGRASENISVRLQDGSIFVPVSISGETRFWLLDSGATMSVIDSQYARNMGIEVAGRIKGSGFGQNFELAFASLPGYHLEGLRLDAQKVYAYEGFAANYTDFPVVGILGYDFLSRFVTRIDYAQKTLSVFDPRHFQYRGNGQVIDAPHKQRVFSVPMTVDGHLEGIWSLDIGAHNSSFNFTFARENGLLQRPGVERLSAGIRSVYRERTIAFDKARIGRFVVYHPRLAIPLKKGVGSTSQVERIGTIGNNLLRRFVLYMDYGRQQIILEKGADFDRRFAEDRSGLQLYLGDHDRVMVALAAPGTPAAEAGLRAGDVILAMDGRAGSGRAWMKKIVGQLQATNAEKVELTVLRQDRQQSIQLLLRNLFATP